MSEKEIVMKKARILPLILITSFLVAPGLARNQSAPQEDDNYASIPFVKAINPAFTDAYANKWVRFKAKFISQVSAVVDLPPEYRKYIRFMVMDPASGAEHSMSLVISKEKSDPLFDLRSEDTIEIFAYSIRVDPKSVITYEAQSLLLFRVEKIVKI